MKRDNELIHFLTRNQIRPSSFAFFLSEYIKTRPREKRAALAVVLSESMQRQAELIRSCL